MILKLSSPRTASHVTITVKEFEKNHISYIMFIKTDGLTKFSTKHPQKSIDYDYLNRCKITGIDEI